jgi:hypothetical protein
VGQRVLCHALLGVVLVQSPEPGKATEGESPPARREAAAGGVRVRVTTARGRKAEGSIRGTLVALNDDLMTVLIDEGRGSAPLQIPIRTVSKVEVSRGRKGHALVGAIAGLLGGAAVGVAFAPAGGSAGCTVDRPYCGESLTPGAALAAAAVGLPLGALVGHLIRTEQWSPVDVHALEITVHPVSGATLGAAVTIRF